MIQASVWDKDLRRKLQSLAGQAKQRVFRRAMHRVGRPAADKLEAAWKAAKRRRGRTTTKIAQAQKVSVRVFQRTSATRGDAVMEIGTKYAKGKSKVWHILERGFKHYRKSAAYASKPSLYGAKAAMRDHMKQAMKLAPKGRGAAARSARHAYKAAAAREWVAGNGAVAAELDAMKKKRRTAIRASSRGATRIKGWFVSSAVADRHGKGMATDLAKELLRAYEIELKGGTA